MIRHVVKISDAFRDLFRKAPEIHCKTFGCKTPVEDIDEYCDECLYERMKHEVSEER